MAINMSNSKLQIVLISDDSRQICRLFRLAVSITELGHHVALVSSLSCIKAIATDPSNPNPSCLDLVPLPLDNAAKFGEEFKKFLSEATQDFDWVLYDTSAFWVPSISNELGIHSAYITFESAIACFSWWPDICESGKPKADQVVGQKYGSPVEAPTVINHPLLPIKRNLRALHCRMNEAIRKCDIVVLPSYNLIDGRLPERLEKSSRKQVCSFGHVPQTATSAADNCAVNSAIIRKWLDKKGQRSVIYVAFESEISVSAAAIALGLECSRFPFVWVTGDPQGGQTINPSNEFVERTKSYGLVCNHWVPHAGILSHPSIGGFLTNGAWSLCIEALDFGIPLILAPISTAEEPNALYMEEKGLGRVIKRSRSGLYSFEVARMLVFVMVDAGGKEIQERVWALRGLFSELQNPHLLSFLNTLIDIKEKNVKGTCTFTQRITVSVTIIRRMLTRYRAPSKSRKWKSKIKNLLNFKYLW